MDSSNTDSRNDGNRLDYRANHRRGDQLDDASAGHAEGTETSCTADVPSDKT